MSDDAKTETLTFLINISFSKTIPNTYVMAPLPVMYATEKAIIVFVLQSAPPGISLNRITLSSGEDQIIGEEKAVNGAVIVTDVYTALVEIKMNVIINLPGGGIQKFDPQVINRPPQALSAA